MIAVIDVKIQAANPTTALFPWRAFVGSPSSLRIRNVPKRIGLWNINEVYVNVLYPDKQPITKQCVLVGGVWVATIESTDTIGYSEKGYAVFANGVDEDGNEVRDYCLGRGAVEIISTNGIVTPEATGKIIYIYSEQPEEPKDGDMWFNGNQYVIYDKGKITVLGGFEPTEAQQEALDSGITAEKVDSMLDEQDVKDIVLEETEAVPAGWSCEPSEFEGEKIEIVYDSDSKGYFPSTNGDQWGDIIEESYPPSEGMRLEWIATTQWAGTNTNLVATYHETAKEPENVLGLVTYDYLSANAVPKYGFETASEAGAITLKPYTSISLTSTGTNFTVAIETSTENKSRECMLVVEASVTAPTITWPENFHPRTDSATDFVCEEGRNVYWISEYMPDRFVVARWLETDGGSAT